MKMKYNHFDLIVVVEIGVKNVVVVVVFVVVNVVVLNVVVGGVGIPAGLDPTAYDVSKLLN